MKNLVYEPVSVKVWGDFACFTRPEMKVERVSYDCMTPSAARGILEAIFWKPEFRWVIREIHVLKPIRYFSILRNEVKSRASLRSAENWLKQSQSDGARNGYFADEDRTQRHTLALRDIAYVIYADVALHPHATDDPAKYRDQFRRRVANGQCCSTPYFGVREFPAFFREVSETDTPIAFYADIGMMLWDIAYISDGTARGNPLFFHAQLDNGVLRIPTPEFMQQEAQ